eukprot:scaffold14634_cov61-Phaeocystis_antarctica.AAC.7
MHDARSHLSRPVTRRRPRVRGVVPIPVISQSGQYGVSKTTVNNLNTRSSPTLQLPSFMRPELIRNRRMH